MNVIFDTCHVILVIGCQEIIQIVHTALFFIKQPNKLMDYSEHWTHFNDKRFHAPANKDQLKIVCCIWSRRKTWNECNPTDSVLNWGDTPKQIINHQLNTYQCNADPHVLVVLNKNKLTLTSKFVSIRLRASCFNRTRHATDMIPLESQLCYIQQSISICQYSPVHYLLLFIMSVCYPDLRRW